MQTEFNPMIAYHAKREMRGWSEVCRYPANWAGWHAFDRSMIQELLAHGHDTVTCGWNMYQVVREEVTA